MNFMPGRSGFYEEVPASRSSSSSSSSSFHQRSHLPPYTYGSAPSPPPPPPFMESCGGEGDETPDDSFVDDHNMLFGRGCGEGRSTAVVIQREHMFDKVVTPSDVGKLNRLVIPKQHAEKYFPLDSSTNEKGLLLNFEDRNGKPWRFRYSYWNSSQSYVMTKGWSRFVKEKKLDAGDIVSFQRGVGELGKDRLFIDWRRRPDVPPPDLSGHHFSFYRPPALSQSVVNPCGPPPLFMQLPPPSRDQYYSHFLHANNAITTTHHPERHPYSAYGSIVNGNPCPPGSIMYLRSTLGGGAGGRGGVLAPVPQMQEQQNRGAGGHDEHMVFESVPVVQGKAAPKRLRLFGVNMDCPISDSDDNNNNNERDILLSSSATMLPYIHPTMLPLPSPAVPFDSLSFSSSLARFRPNDDNKGKGSMSLDLDI